MGDYLLRVTLAYVSVEPETLANGAIPNPLRAADCLLLATLPELSVTVNEPVYGVAVPGVKVIPMVQLAPAAKVADAAVLQVPAFVPVALP